jgi:hypothetical protein
VRELSQYVRMNLLARTRELLQEARNAGYSLHQIVELSNGETNYEWLRAFVAQRNPNPQVLSVQGLYNALTRILPSKGRRYG